MVPSANGESGVERCPGQALCKKKGANHLGRRAMLGGKQDLSRLTRRNAERSSRADSSVTSNRSLDAVNARLCPACTRPMAHVRTIWRAVHDDLQVFECRACDVWVSAKV